MDATPAGAENIPLLRSTQDTTTTLPPLSPAPTSWMAFLFSLLQRKVPSPPARRFLHRADLSAQSYGVFNIKKRIRVADKRSLYYGDWFHSLIDLPTHKLIFVLLSGYMALTVFFAIPYYAIAKFFSCNMGISNFQEAFAFSLGT